jgi:mannose-6-phosphate isomerase-like protein (cupin superfamily)
MASYLLLPGETRREARYVGGEVRVLAGVEDTGDSLSVIEAHVGKGGPPLHIHEERDELLFVLEGTLTIRVGDTTYDAGPGAAAWIPHGTPHAFANPSEAPARLIGICTPGGLEKSLTAHADYMTGLSPAEQPDPQKLAEIVAKHDGGRVVGPPILDSE